MQIFSNLTQGIQYAREQLKKYGELTDPTSWQGIKKDYKMFEVDNVYFRCCMPSTQIALEQQVKPDMPWAEDHFQERIGGVPLNPGVQYKNWPGYKDVDFNDKNFRKEGNFTHTYMERYWPKTAGHRVTMLKDNENQGIRYEYGDLEDVVELLLRQPYTRQAYLPVWFPEDTGVKHGGRVPCTIGYHFMRKGDDLNVHYMIRACDYIRHFRNDIYLTVRLVQWVLNQLKAEPPGEVSRDWANVQPGIFTMDIVHFHVFAQEKNLI